VTHEARTQSLGSSPARAVRRARLRVASGPDRGLEYVLEETSPVSVGLAPGNDLRLSDPTISRYHLELDIGDKGIHLQDLGSLNGTYASGLRLVEAYLHPGTTLGLGKTLIVIDALDDMAAEPTSDVAPIEEIVAESAAMREVVRKVRRVASTDSFVLIQGETGTGKEVVARSIHRLSLRAGGPFEVVDCGALPANLVSSELFGHERGAFTGAPRRHIGAIERAHGGTLFLDEIGELPLEMQPMLLGALERRRYRRVGGESEIQVDLRVIAATHRDLREAANLGSFRADLYYRLAVARIVVPPLREHPTDIPELVHRFVQQLTGARAPLPFDEFTLASLKVQHFPGNVRELRNLVESALAFGSEPTDSDVSRLEPSIEGVPSAGTIRPPPKALAEKSAAIESSVGCEGGDSTGGSSSQRVSTYGEARDRAIADFERDYLSRMMSDCDHNVSEAARRAKMDRPYLLKLLRRHGLR
jgi:DNA-binding NtrC family response regulator